MSIVLNNQIEASEKSAAELENRIENHDNVLDNHRLAIICCEVEDLIVSTLAIFKAINHGTERFQSLGVGPETEKLESVRFELYKRMNKLFAKLDWLARAMKHEGFNDFNGINDLALAWREVRGIVSVEPSSITTAKTQIAGGRCKTLAEVRNELWGDSVH